VQAGEQDSAHCACDAADGGAAQRDSPACCRGGRDDHLDDGTVGLLAARRHRSRTVDGSKHTRTLCAARAPQRARSAQPGQHTCLRSTGRCRLPCAARARTPPGEAANQPGRPAAKACGLLSSSRRSGDRQRAHVPRRHSATERARGKRPCVVCRALQRLWTSTTEAVRSSLLVTRRRTADEYALCHVTAAKLAEKHTKPIRNRRERDAASTAA